MRTVCARLGTGFTGRRAEHSGITWHWSGALSRPLIATLYAHPYKKYSDSPKMVACSAPPFGGRRSVDSHYFFSLWGNLWNMRAVLRGVRFHLHIPLVDRGHFCLTCRHSLGRFLVILRLCSDSKEDCRSHLGSFLFWGRCCVTNRAIFTHPYLLTCVVGFCFARVLASRIR